MSSDRIAAFSESLANKTMTPYGWMRKAVEESGLGDLLGAAGEAVYTESASEPYFVRTREQLRAALAAFDKKVAKV